MKTKKIIAIELLSLTFGAEVIRDGIWFDYNYFQGGLVGGTDAVLTGQPLLLLAGISNFGFQ